LREKREGKKNNLEECRKFLCESGEVLVRGERKEEKNCGGF